MLKLSRALVIAIALIAIAQTGTIAQIVFSERSLAEDFPKPDAPPAITIVVIRDKPLWKKAVSSLVVRPAKATGRAAKRLGKFINAGNQKLHPLRDCAETVLSAAAMWFFIKENF